MDSLEQFRHMMEAPSHSHSPVISELIWDRVKMQILCLKPRLSGSHTWSPQPQITLLQANSQRGANTELVGLSLAICFWMGLHFS